MKNWQSTLVSPHTSILEAIHIIDRSSMQIAVVTDGEHCLLGTVTDGDVRRGLLNNIALDRPVSTIMKKNPKVAYDWESEEAILARLTEFSLHQIPILNNRKQVVNVETLDNLIKQPVYENEVFLMAGGLGTRLQPLTNLMPKPMLKIGSKPILETIIQNFAEHGFHRISIAVNYHSEIIEEYFKDGKDWNVSIRYVHENKRLGTAGALSLIKEKPTSPFFVMNADILTKVNFKQMLDFHLEHHAAATMSVRQYDMQVPYGVVKVNGFQLLGIEEKPISQYFINGGIYILNPLALDYVPQDEFFDMPSLFEHLIEHEQTISAFPIREYWLDIGRKQDFDRANDEFQNFFP